MLAEAAECAARSAMWIGHNFATIRCVHEVSAPHLKHSAELSAADFQVIKVVRPDLHHLDALGLKDGYLTRLMKEVNRLSS